MRSPTTPTRRYVPRAAHAPHPPRAPPVATCSPPLAPSDEFDQRIWAARPDGYHDYYNRRWYDYTGVDLGSTDGDRWNDMFHPDGRERAWTVWRYSLRTGELYHIEYR